MSAKKQGSRIESVRDAVTGYTVVVLGIVCFILALIVIVAAVRLVTGLGAGASSATVATTVAGLGVGA